MKVRPIILIAFLGGISFSLYLGLADIKLEHDKLIHFVDFFVLTILFYFIFDTNSLKMLRNLTFLTCTFAASVGSEVIQSLINKNRTFDPKDILSNFGGSLLGLVLSQFGHKKLNDKKKMQRYEHVQVDESVVDQEDLELGDLSVGK